MCFAFKFFVLLVTSANAIENVYDGYKVYDVKAKSEKDLQFLKNLETSEGEQRSLDFFSLHNNFNDVVRLMVKPEEQNYVEDIFIQKNIDFKVTVENIQEKIDKEFEEHEILANRKSEVLTFDRYYRHDEINKYLDRLEQEFNSNSQVKVKTVGKSFEGRDIKIVTITNRDRKAKNSIFIDAGIHAREWIAPATALYWINQLVDSQSNISKLLDEFDFVVQPIVNPDGYEYTFNRYRLWRKTRSTNGSPCQGVDSNRNYEFHWNEKGSSNNKCAETYHGPSPFSEKESQISRDVMHGIKENCKFFLTLHSYGNYLLYPWAATMDLPDNWQDMEDVAQAGARAMRDATGVNYTVGSVSKTLYIASGGSIDYAHAEENIPISIVMELGGGGWFGFDLPPRDIDRNVKESAIGIHAMSEIVAQKFRN